MSTTIHLSSEFDRLNIELEDGNTGESQTIWIRSRTSHGVTISLYMNPTNRAKLRAVLDQADAIANKFTED